MRHGITAFSVFPCTYRSGSFRCSVFQHICTADDGNWLAGSPHSWSFYFFNNDNRLILPERRSYNWSLTGWVQLLKLYQKIYSSQYSNKHILRYYFRPFAENILLDQKKTSVLQSVISYWKQITKRYLYLPAQFLYVPEYKYLFYIYILKFASHFLIVLIYFPIMHFCSPV